MDTLLSEISALLLKDYLFYGLDVDEITRLAAQFRPVRKVPDQTVYDQDSEARFFYVVFKGQVKVSIANRDPGNAIRNLSAKLSGKPIEKGNQIIDLYTYGPGIYFGEEALLFNRREPEIVRTTKNSVLLRMERQAFFDMLDEFPTVEEKLITTAKSRRLARSKRLPWFSEGEAVELFRRKHPFFLIRSLILPVLLFILSLFFYVYTSTQIDPTTFLRIIRIFSIVSMLGAVGWFIWNWIDWGNDFYIVTTQRVIWMEKIVGLFSSRNEAPLHTILAVDILSDQAGRIMNYGDVSARTYTGKIPMRDVTNPKQIQGYIEGNKKRVIEFSKDAEIEQIREDVRKALRDQQVSATPDLQKLVVKSIPTQTAKQTNGSSFRKGLQNFLRVRYEQDGVITYRKHWFLLFRKVWLPLLLMLLLFLFIFLTGRRWTEGGDPLLTANTLLLIGSVGFIGFVLWLIYSYVDWINDIYQLTPEFIVDIERKPLGSEQKKTANIANILSIEHHRQNLSGILLNFGTVTVYVGDTEFIFNGVYNPNLVHQDISDYQEAMLRKKREIEADRDRKTMVDWLMTYHDETEKRTEEEKGKPLNFD